MSRPEPRRPRAHAAPAPGAAHVHLVGGPADLPQELRRHFLRAETDTVTIPHRGGYEHFACVTSTRESGGTPVYQWTKRTTTAR
ncbi:DUF5988 family protein [Nocardiopsis sp. Huas11]|uniref:DUF5988 family protein n=1 Tax=Nocardiopsis sp. Huas11 TaxID=2183912 RepID=UPI000EB039F2|nr:DUF5988 family protein [Nocardiopsis sp. Huas11]